MGLTKRSESKTIYLAAKHFSLWQEVKAGTKGAEEVEVNNPSTGETVKKHGFKYEKVSGHATAMVWYDTEKKYSARYFGFKLHLRDGADSFVLDMPYQSQLLRRFLRTAPAFNWYEPLSISIFKGKKKGDKIELGVWFQQGGTTVKPYFSREHPNDMPDAIQDTVTGDWDFKPQMRWLVMHLKERTIPAIEAAAQQLANREEEFIAEPEPEPHMEDSGIPPNSEITDEDCPF